METNNILTADILDILFEGRNKMYGAYELRKTYNKRITKALLLTGSLLAAIVLTSVFAGTGKKIDKGVIKGDDVLLAEIKKEQPAVITPPPVKIKPVELNQRKLLQQIVITKEETKADKIEEITDETAISNINVFNENTEAKVQAPFEETSTVVFETPKTEDEDIVFKSVQIEAEFPGGNAAWARYMQKSLENFNPAENGAAPGKYQVIVKFIVSKDGSISNVEAETSFGFGMEELAVKAIKKGPNWKPALQNGRNVNAYRRQPVTFVVNEE